MVVVWYGFNRMLCEHMTVMDAYEDRLNVCLRLPT